MNISRLSIFNDVPVSVVYEVVETTRSVVVLTRIHSTARVHAEERESVVSVACPSSIEPTHRAVDVLAVIPATGSPVQFVRVPDVGVPSIGVVNVGEVRVLFARVTVPSRVITDVDVFPCVVIARSPVPIVSRADVCVATQFPFAIFITAPLARNKSDQLCVVSPRGAPSSVVGLSFVVIVGDVSTHADAVDAPVNVLAASVLAIVAEVVGNVITVLSVPESVIVFVTARVFAFVIVIVPVVVVIVSPLTDVAVATPSTGVTSDGLVSLTGAPDPVAVVQIGRAEAPPPTRISVVAPVARV